MPQPERQFVELFDAPPMTMPYELQRFAASRYPEWHDRKGRINEAENKLLRLYLGESGVGFFIEVGANDPVVSSKTWHLEQAGWSGLLIEPIPELCEQLCRGRPNSHVVEAACVAPQNRGSANFFIAKGLTQSSLEPYRLHLNSEIVDVIQVEAKTLDEILASTDHPRIDFVSIDVEGLQLDVLKGFDIRRYQPRLLLVEDHLRDLQTHRYLVGEGYQIVKRTVRNNWYVPQGTEFPLTSPLEDWLLWQRVWIRTPFRRLKSGMRSVVRRITPAR